MSLPRFGRAIGVAALLILGAWWLWPRDAPVEAPPAEGAAHVVRLRRGQAPARLVVPVAASAPARAPVEEVPPDRAPARRLALEDLPDEARSALGASAMERLRALADACAAEASEPQSVGAFVTLDAAGVVEMELRAVDPDAERVEVVDLDLPDALVDCLDDALWAQDWSGSGVPEGAELPIALTLRLGD